MATFRFSFRFSPFNWACRLCFAMCVASSFIWMVSIGSSVMHEVNYQNSRSKNTTTTRLMNKMASLFLPFWYNVCFFPVSLLFLFYSGSRCCRSLPIQTHKLCSFVLAVSMIFWHFSMLLLFPRLRCWPNVSCVTLSPTTHLLALKGNSQKKSKQQKGGRRKENKRTIKHTNSL